MKCGILCGGKGLRFGNSDIPKVMARIGGRPILEHIMEHYFKHGINEFVLLIGYKGDVIVDYFKKNPPKYAVEFKETGAESETGTRVEKAKGALGDDFFLTYGDGVSDIDINDESHFHDKHDKLATMTVVYLPSQFGKVNVDNNCNVEVFTEKPVLKDHLINAGFFIFRNGSKIDFNGSLERDVLPRLADAGQLKAYHHNGFWRCMDTFKDYHELNELWNSKGGNLI